MRQTLTDRPLERGEEAVHDRCLQDLLPDLGHYLGREDFEGTAHLGHHIGFPVDRVHVADDRIHDRERQSHIVDFAGHESCHVSGARVSSAYALNA
jgi:hypothetical protein